MKICELVANLASRISTFTNGEIKIINNIDPRFEADPANKLLGDTISNILNNISCNNVASPVKIWAKQFHNITVIHFKYRDSRPAPQIDETFKEASLAAEQMGGCLYITTAKQNEMSVAFTFLTTQKQRVYIPSENIPAYHSQRRLSA